MVDHMASPLVCVVYVYGQFITHHYIILSVLLTVERWQLHGVLTEATTKPQQRHKHDCDSIKQFNKNLTEFALVHLNFNW